MSDGALSRVWAMPNRRTFAVPPIAAFIARHLRGVSVDPFAGNTSLATWRNDLNPTTAAPHHVDAEAFVHHLHRQGVRADTLIFDPPYSPRQITECYHSAGLAIGMTETQNGALYARVRDAALSILAPDATVLSFGWNSAGMGTKRGFAMTEILLVAHGGAHNDTICVAERRIQPELFAPGLTCPIP